jgi:hypothetical protein
VNLSVDVKQYIIRTFNNLGAKANKLCRKRNIASYLQAKSFQKYKKKYFIESAILMAHPGDLNATQINNVE